MIPASSNEELLSEVTPLVRATDSSTTTRLDSDPETGRETSKNGTDTNGRGGNGTDGFFEKNDFDHFVDTTAEEELDKPWPATFERSISLLAGPIRDTQFIEEITKSPKIITPNIRDRRRVRI
jgi:hypothetical protein